MTRKLFQVQKIFRSLYGFYEPKLPVTIKKDPNLLPCGIRCGLWRSNRHHEIVLVLK